MEETVVATEEATPAAKEAAGPSFKDHVASLTGAQRDHWQLTGELPEESDVKAESSTATEESESSADEAGTDKTEAAPDPAGKKEQHKGPRTSWGELREAKARAEARAELLEQQLAESRKSPPAKEEPKVEAARVDPARPKRPRMDDPAFDTVEKYEAAMDAYEEAKDRYSAQTVEQRENQRKQEFEFKSASEKWESIKESGRTEYKDFEAVAFNPKVPASLAAIVELQSREDGHKLMYHLGKNPELAKELAELTDIPGPYKTYAELTAQALKDPQFALQLGEKRGIAKAEIARIAKTLGSRKATPSKETIARQAKPSGEIAVEPNASPAEDELTEAIKSRNQSAYNRIMNKREMAGAGA